MAKSKYALAICLIFAATEVGAAPQVCNIIDGSIVINSDNEYIGAITNKYDNDSIYNKYGTYGSKYETESIWNKFGKNGSQFQSGSAFNRYEFDPPKIIKDKQIIGYLTVNKNVNGAIDPLILGVVCYDFDPSR